MSEAKTPPAGSARKIPAPAWNEESQPFWDAAREERLLIKRCTECAEPHWYPRALCPFCGSAATEWLESAGEGSIYSFSVSRQNKLAPYALAYVSLDEGVSLLTNIVDCDLDRLTIGQRVKLRWVPTEGPPAFAFGPVD